MTNTMTPYIDRTDLEIRCLLFLEVQGVKPHSLPGIERLDALVLQCLALLDPDWDEFMSTMREDADALLSSREVMVSTRRFNECFDLAGRMEQILRAGPLQDHEDLDIDEDDPIGPFSPFRMKAAVALDNLPDDQWEEVFAVCVNDPHRLMEWLDEVVRPADEDDAENESILH